MKTTTTIATGLLFALAISAQAATTTVFSESFANPTGSNRRLDAIANVHAYHGASATAYALTSSTSATEPINSGPLGGFAFNAANSGQASFIYLSGISGGAASQFDSVEFDLLNSDGAENVRATIQIGGAWYVTNTTYNATSGSNTFTTQSTTGTTWKNLNFTAGTSMSIGSAASLPITGTVTGVGIYDESRTNSIRFRNLKILAVPEPSGAMLLGATGLLVLLRRRR